ncbi:hypothetical protein ACF07Y_37460 [Streptomyces sp. NPDC016566]|uniref:hypothetical protein n=1 Tax=Streptomyces sp. NPDC016566 TaxID=3364967 RepID=UPI0036F8B206
MLQDVLGEPEWAELLTPADRRGLAPLFWSHVRPYGEVSLDMGARLNLAAVSVPGPRAPGPSRPDHAIHCEERITCVCRAPRANRVGASHGASPTPSPTTAAGAATSPGSPGFSRDGFPSAAGSMVPRVLFLLEARSPKRVVQRPSGLAGVLSQCG